MKVLAIDTSCDETAAAVTNDKKILSNIIWSQASLHAKFGGVMPSLAQRQHEEHIDWVVEKAIKVSKLSMKEVEAIAVTVGPGLSIALGVGINKAKELAKIYKKPLIAINHTESHVLSPLAESKNKKGAKIKFPAYGLVVSGGNTVFVLIEKIGKYKILAQTVDDALGEALDKGARMFGFGYPGGAILEKMARKGSSKQIDFKLPIPLSGQESRQIFSYSGLKSSLFRLIEKEKSNDQSFPSKEQIYNLSAIYQDVAFKHLLRVIEYHITKNPNHVSSLLLGGGVAANIEIRSRLRKLGKKLDFKLLTPYSKKLYCDNAAMIGITASLRKNKKSSLKVDRFPNLKIDNN